MTKTYSRAAVFDQSAINIEARTVEIAFSSEFPYPRSFGMEVLSHDQADVDLSFIASGSAPLLLEHDPEEQIGVVERAWLDPDRRCRAVVRFSRSEDGEEVFQDVVDGIRKNISCKYTITDMRAEKRNGNQVVLCAWSPYEISVVSIPVDTTVGVGRSVESTVDNTEINKTEVGSQPDALNNGSQSEETNSSRQAAQLESANDSQENETAQRGQSITNNNYKDITMETNQNESRALDADSIISQSRSRDDAIEAIVEKFNLGRSAYKEFRDSGKSIDEIRAIVFEKLPAATPAVSGIAQNASIGLTNKEVRQYSLGRAVRALMTGDARDAGFEMEVSRAVAAKLNQLPSANTFYVPEDYMRAAPAESITSAAGLVGTDYRANSLIDLIYAQTAAQRAGVRFEQGLVGNVSFPRGTSGAAGYWVGEGEDINLSSLTFDNVQMSPKGVGGIVPITQEALVQSLPFLENLVQNNLRTVISQKIDESVFGRGGAKAPVGLGAIAGITTPAGSPTALSYSDLRKLILALEDANIFTDNAKFVTNAGVANLLSSTLQDTNTIAKYLRSEDGKTIGYDTVVSANVGNNLFFGDFSNVLVGSWAGIRLDVDTSQGFLNGSRLVRALAMVDVAVLRDEAITGYKNIDLG